MAETLGHLLDKLTIVKLKEHHTTDIFRLTDLADQANNLRIEIDDYIAKAARGDIPRALLSFNANKVVKGGDPTSEIASPNIAGVFSTLADTNIELWHVQENINSNEPNEITYEIMKDIFHKQRDLNLRRNKCIDRINELFKELIR